MSGLIELAPVTTAGLLRPLHDELMRVLRGLERDAWDRPTVAGSWTVRDVVAHLWDGDLRRLSLQRDGHSPPKPDTRIDDYDGLVAYLNELNRVWVTATRRLSPEVLLAFIESSGPVFCDLMESLDPFAVAVFPVAWADEQTSLNWMDIGREYTEKWHHQQQIRDAAGVPLLLDAKWTRPLFDLSVRALPRALRDVEAPAGGAVVVEIDGAGAWSAVSSGGSWHVYAGRADGALATVRMSPDVAWRLFYNALSPAAAAAIEVSGRTDLAERVRRVRSVMV